MNDKKDNKIIEMMNDASICPLLEESKVGVSDYTKLPVCRLSAIGTAFQPLATADRGIWCGRKRDLLC